MTETKRCKTCEDVKPLADFPLYHSERYKKDKRKPHCRECTNLRARGYWNSKYKTDEEKQKYRKHWHLMSTYGISLDEYTEMYETQLGECYICDARHDVLHVDHCHKDGHVRKLLCGKCNTGLGAFNDNIDLLHRAITYITQESK